MSLALSIYYLNSSLNAVATYIFLGFIEVILHTH
jgi:hypothetical protein